jgi:acyl carrier protein
MISTNKDKLRKIIAEVIEIEDFDEDDRFAEDLGVDSMMVLELVAKIEQEWGVSIPEEDYPQMGSLSEVHTLIAKLTE